MGSGNGAWPALFVDVAARIPDALFELAYFGSDNFVGRRVDGYEAAVPLLTRPAADALAQVAERAAGEGLRLHVFDCYRPARAVAHFARWAAAPCDPAQKARFYPDLDKADLFTAGYIAARSGHSRGSTVDLTLQDARTGRDLDMGTPFDLFGPASWTHAAGLAPEQSANRRRLLRLMDAAGFEGFDMEWWHFTLRGEPFPDTYFDFPITRAPVEEPQGTGP